MKEKLENDNSSAKCRISRPEAIFVFLGSSKISNITGTEEVNMVL